jgi:CheY-like chemotaxis protein
VLLVEDDEDSRQMLTDTLEYYGARVTAVSSATEALRLLATDHADVLLSDLRLPEKDGFALIHELRMGADPALAMIPAASITASRLTDDRQHALAAGYQVHLEKPVDPDDLASTVLSLATKRRDNDDAAH